MKGNKGFLILEVLIACLILTSAVAASMFLFRMGFDHLDRANTSNILSSKLPQAVSLMRACELEKGSGSEDMGDDVGLEWASTMSDKAMPGTSGSGGMYELFLYKVHIKLTYRKTSREYDLNVFKNRRVGSPEEFAD